MTLMSNDLRTNLSFALVQEILLKLGKFKFIHVPRTLAIMENFAWTFSNCLITS